MAKMTYVQLVESLIKATQMMNLTRVEVAALSGWGPHTIAKWYSSPKNPPLSQYVDWAETLGYEVILIRKGQPIVLSDELVSS